MNYFVKDAAEGKASFSETKGQPKPIVQNNSVLQKSLELILAFLFHHI